MNLSDDLLEIAKKDLSAAKCLYDKELYPQAVFYLQQSVEKAAKSFVIMADMLKGEEIKIIGHYPLRIHKKLLDVYKGKVKSFKEMTEVIPKLKDVPLIKDIEVSQVERHINNERKAIVLTCPQQLYHLLS